jgi:hypothetical protein
LDGELSKEPGKLNIRKSEWQERANLYGRAAATNLQRFDSCPRSVRAATDLQRFDFLNLTVRARCNEFAAVRFYPWSVHAIRFYPRSVRAVRFYPWSVHAATKARRFTS